MRCIPCKVTFEGFRYEIKADGSVFGQDGAKRNERSAGAFTDAVIDADHAKLVRADAARQRRNRNAREKHDALTSLGLVRVRGALGGVYYE